MRFFWIGVALGGALVLQTTEARWVPGGGVTFDLVLVVVVLVALATGPLSGLLTGTVGGIAQDALSGGIIGVGGLAKTIVGFVIGVIGFQFIVTGPAQRFIVLFMATLLHGLVFLGLYEMLPPGRSIEAPYRTVLIQALANAAVGVAALQLAVLVPRLALRRHATRGHAIQRREWESR